MGATEVFKNQSFKSQLFSSSQKKNTSDRNHGLTLMIFHIENWFESQILALFDSMPLIQNSKFNNFLWARWFIGKNLSNFVSPVWKLYNPYCYISHNISWHMYHLRYVIWLFAIWILIALFMWSWIMVAPVMEFQVHGYKINKV